MTSNGSRLRSTATSSRTPPFLIVALLLGLCVLGFNYWSVSSKNSECRNMLNDKHAEAQMMRLKNSNSEKRSEALRDRLREMEGAIAQTKREVAAKATEMESARLSSQTDMKEKEQNLRICEDVKAGIQEELETVKKQAAAEQSTAISESSCAAFTSKHNKEMIDMIERTLGPVAIQSLQQAGMDVGEYRLGVKGVANQQPVQGQQPANPQQQMPVQGQQPANPQQQIPVQDTQPAIPQQQLNQQQQFQVQPPINVGQQTQMETGAQQSQQQLQDQKYQISVQTNELPGKFKEQDSQSQGRIPQIQEQQLNPQGQQVPLTEKPQENMIQQFNSKEQLLPPKPNNTSKPGFQDLNEQSKSQTNLLQVQESQDELGDRYGQDRKSNDLQKQSLAAVGGKDEVNGVLQKPESQNRLIAPENVKEINPQDDMKGQQAGWQVGKHNASLIHTNFTNKPFMPASQSHDINNTNMHEHTTKKVDKSTSALEKSTHPTMTTKTSVSLHKTTTAMSNVSLPETSTATSVNKLKSLIFNDKLIPSDRKSDLLVGKFPKSDNSLEKIKKSLNENKHIDEVKRGPGVEELERGRKQKQDNRFDDVDDKIDSKQGDDTLRFKSQLKNGIVSELKKEQESIDELHAGMKRRFDDA